MQKLIFSLVLVVAGMVGCAIMARRRRKLSNSQVALKSFRQLDKLDSSGAWGGWLRPFPNVAALGFLDIIPPILWFAIKVVVFLYFYLWFRASWPRYRYDQLMKLGWQWLLPLSMANVILTAVLMLLLK